LIGWLIDGRVACMGVAVL